MAVNTAEKRRSLISWARPWMPQPPLPDSSFSEGDRYQLAWLYRFPLDFRLIAACPPVFTLVDVAPVITAVSADPAIVLVDTAPTLSQIETAAIILQIAGDPTIEQIATDPLIAEYSCEG